MTRYEGNKCREQIQGTWIKCEDRLPSERKEGIGTVSDRVIVELSDGNIAEDWLINGRWVVHCRKNGSAYPIRWKNGTYD